MLLVVQKNGNEIEKVEKAVFIPKKSGCIVCGCTVSNDILCNRCKDKEVKDENTRNLLSQWWSLLSD